MGDIYAYYIQFVLDSLITHAYHIGILPGDYRNSSCYEVKAPRHDVGVDGAFERPVRQAADQEGAEGQV